jgi:hypothetical protein
VKTPEVVLADVARRLSNRWAADVAQEGPPSWPHEFPLGQPTGTELAGGFAEVPRHVATWRAWATERGVTLRARTRRVLGTDQELPTHVLVPDLDTAAVLVGTGWPERIGRGRTRAHALRAAYPHVSSVGRLVATLDQMSDVDVDLLRRAADWFAISDASGLTPRQVPIEGLHAKWLNTRRALVRELANVPELGLLPPHPARLHFTYLDPAYLASGARRHDSATVGDTTCPAYRPTVVVISENKDTALHLLPVPGGISVEGVGRGGSTAAAFPWLTDAPAVFYWGDMDADGLEILDGFRAAGVPARSLLMGPQAYEQWERFGTNEDPRGRPLTARTPRPTPFLITDERALYEQLVDPDWTRNRRIEQERIPLAVAATELIRLLTTEASAGRAATDATAGPGARDAAPGHEVVTCP